MVTPVELEVCNLASGLKGLLLSSVLNFRREMFSGDWGIGLIFSPDAHLYEINSFWRHQASKSRIESNLDL